MDAIDNLIQAIGGSWGTILNHVLWMLEPSIEFDFFFPPLSARKKHDSK